MSQIDKRIKVNTIIENQLPEFVVADFPNATEFFKQYYISQEFQGGPSDLINNFDQYLKSDNLVPKYMSDILIERTQTRAESYFPENDKHMMNFDKKLMDNIDKFIKNL